mgnify:CR=1 FL=1
MSANMELTQAQIDACRDSFAAYVLELQFRCKLAFPLAEKVALLCLRRQV